MKKVNLSFKNEPWALSISSDGEEFDTSRIEGLPVSQWAFPFRNGETEWKGIYEEIKNFVGQDEFTIQFDGAKTDQETLKYALENTSAKLIRSNNNVVILYSENPFTTKVNVNGEVFDTARIQNRSIEEWSKPIEQRGLEWKGIFKELEEFIGTDEYNVQFMGDQSLMQYLMETCPAGVNVTYRMPLKKSVGIAAAGAGAAAGGAAVSAKTELSNAAGLVKGKIKEKVTDDEVERNLDNIPIKNKYVRQHLMAICAGIIYLFMLFPFVTFTNSRMSSGESITGNAYEALGGLRVHFSYIGDSYNESLPGSGTMFAIALIIIPGIIIAMNYVNQLKPYRRIIAIIGPAAGIAFEIITIIALPGRIYSSMGVSASELSSQYKFSTVVGAGFVLMIIMYAIVAIVGMITYYGYKLPNNKQA